MKRKGKKVKSILITWILSAAVFTAGLSLETIMVSAEEQPLAEYEDRSETDGKSTEKEGQPKTGGESTEEKREPETGGEPAEEESQSEIDERPTEEESRSEADEKPTEEESQPEAEERPAEEESRPETDKKPTEEGQSESGEEPAGKEEQSETVGEQDGLEDETGSTEETEEVAEELTTEELAGFSLTYDNDKTDLLAECERLKLNIYDAGDAEGTVWIMSLQEGYQEENLVLPEGITGIVKESFRNNSVIKKVVLPSTMKLVDENCFRNSSVEEVIFREGTEIIGEGAFAECSELTKVYLPDSAADLREGIFKGSDKLAECRLPVGLSDIPAEMFSGCAGLVNLEIPSSVEKIGERTFEGCGFRILKLPDNIEELPKQAFTKCKNLEFINIPKETKEIKETVFAYCDKLEEIELPDGLERIGYGAFLNCTKLKSINFPADIYDIGSNVFARTALEEVDLSACGIYALYDRVFSSCKALKTVKLNEGIEYIGSYAFSGCKVLENVSVPDSLNEINSGAFSDTENLKYFDLSHTGIEIIMNNTFQCSGLEEIILPDSVTEIKDWAFAETKLKTMVLPKNLEAIGKYAWGRGENKIVMKELVLPASVYQVGEGAFWGFTGMETIDLSTGYLYNVKKNAFCPPQEEAIHLKELKLSYEMFDYPHVDEGAFNNIQSDKITVVISDEYELGSFENVLGSHRAFLYNIPIQLMEWGFSADTLSSVNVVVQGEQVDIGKYKLQRDVLDKFEGICSTLDGLDLWEQCFTDKGRVQESYTPTPGGYTYQYECDNFYEYCKEIRNSGDYDKMGTAEKGKINAILNSLCSALSEVRDTLPGSLSDLEIVTEIK